MTPRRLLAVLPVALILAALPAVADTAATTALPAVCGGKAPTLAEGQSLVERTVWFHGTNRAGDLDEQQLLGSSMSMNSTKPTGTESKVKTSKPGTLGNDSFSKNGVNGYWTGALGEPTQIVCAGTTVWAVVNGNSIPAQVRVDIPNANTATPAQAKATATAAAGNGPRAFTAVFGLFDSYGESDVSVQFAAPAPGGALLYDSTDYPSSFTYVTVVPPTVPAEPE